MKSTFLIFQALAFGALSMPTNEPEKRQDPSAPPLLICNSSEASPTMEDVTTLINNLRGAADHPPVPRVGVSNVDGNECSQIYTDWSGGGWAQFNICKTGDSYGEFQMQPSHIASPGGVPATFLAGWINDLQHLEGCATASGKIGGIISFENSLGGKIQLF